MKAHRRVTNAAVALAMLAASIAPALAQPQTQQAGAIATREHAVRLVSVVEGLEHPWGLAFLPDGRMLVTERPGRLRVIGADGKLDPVAVAGLPRVDAQSQGGLLDVIAHPRFADNRWVYWVYAQRDASGANGTSWRVAASKARPAPTGCRTCRCCSAWRPSPAPACTSARGWCSTPAACCT